ncbi:hypothetical protein [Streptomyces sp. NPDC029554]|uniref:hypothetical protein n=1 Tax=Streptomyces sp. NPDC029554 TaxID=3155126 RepID=UPI0033E47B24
MAEAPDELIKLERSADEERAKLADLTRDDYDAQWRRWREASKEVQAAVTAARRGVRGQPVRAGAGCEEGLPARSR